MTKLEILDEKAKTLDANKAIFETAKEENRQTTDEEKGIIQANLDRLEDLRYMEISMSFEESVPAKGDKVKPIVHINKREKAAEKFSLIKAINAACENRSFNDISRDLFMKGKDEFRKSHVDFSGNIILPVETRADILAGTATAGEEIVEEDKKTILPPLVDKLIFSQAGVTYLNNLVGNVSIPAYAGTTVDWKTEVEAAADGGGAFSEVVFSPKRLTAYIDVSKQFLQQDGVGAERLLLDNIANAVARKLESTILGNLVGTASRPQGMGYEVTNAAATGSKNAVAATWALIVGMETAVDTANSLVGNLAFITNSAGRGILKTEAKGSTSDDKMLMEDNNTMAGYPVLVTNSCATNAGEDTNGELLVFGNWADLCIGQWGGYDITVDPYSKANTGQVRIVINSFFDAKGLRGSSGSGATLNEYITSFAREPIKAS